METKKTVLIDGDSLIYFEMGKDTLEEGIAGLDDRLNTILDKCGTNKYAGFLTSGRCFRYKTAKTREYKGNRKKSNKPIIFYALKAYLEQTWNFTYTTELEADDLVSMYHKHDGSTVIASPDKDVLYQNPGTHFNFRTAEMVKVSLEEADTFLWKQTLMGDPTDGIPGLPKIGDKTAAKWLVDVPISDMPAFVLNKYIEKFGIQDGILKFTETFNLVYMLKTSEESERIAGVPLPELVTYEVGAPVIKSEDVWP